MNDVIYELRDYQKKLIDGCRNAMVGGQMRVVAYLPTGGGKTAVACGMIKNAVARGKKVAFVCNRNQLIRQTSRVFDEQGIPHGIIQGENTRDIWAQVLVCSIQTVAKRGLPGVDLLILDECHACPGTKAYHDVMRGKYVIGLTATPYQRGMGAHIAPFAGPLFQSVVVGADMKDLIRSGNLVKADVWAPDVPDLSSVRIVAGDYKEDQLSEAMNKPQLVGNVVEHWLHLANGKKTMAFTVDIAHSQSMCRQFIASGVNAVHVDYHMDQHTREAIYKEYRDGATTLLCNCALLSEGADFPACEVLILARPTKSKVRYAQMFGRVLRPSPGKDRAIVLDHSGASLSLGMPWDFSVTHLDDGKPKKSSSRKEVAEKPVPVPKLCAKCSYLKPAGVRICPSCGTEPCKQSEVEHTDGELKKIGDKAKKKVTAIDRLEAIGRQEVYSQLVGICDKRGYKEGWASMKYKDAFGEWPPKSFDKSPSDACGAVLAWECSQRLKYAYGKKRRNG